MNIKASQIRKNIFHFEFDSQYEITSTFMRLQEFYESPLPGIRGNFFTHEQFMDTYAKSKKSGQMTYFTDWCGFNVPGDVVRDFFEMYRYCFGGKELMLLSKLFEIAPDIIDNGEKFYIIGTIEGQNEALNHELAHAYYHMYPEYESDMLSFIDNSILSENYDIVSNKLLEMGYHQDMINDEIQAIFATASNSSMHYTYDIPEDKNPTADLQMFFRGFNSGQEDIFNKLN